MNGKLAGQACRFELSGLFLASSLLAVGLASTFCLLMAPSLVVGAIANKVDPVFDTPAKIEMDFRGFVGDRLRANLEEWELRAPDANPAMVQMFYDRDRKPDRNLLPWSGEFVGKYLCSSILSYRILKDPRQKEMIQRVATALMDAQGSDG
jgi:hypothetical protein